ncbi:hypothetical protein OBBRIDRAFT_834626 [Obba rivulosa]|uniref:Uncharacterized protein n=1 Tax=Obba rivulosa TaxID=1052685 RepID=A0A8E2AZ63_9APHY|nr:hypothetical protein OBBRIDRAFT_834626 [Obba rivulosa]
MSCAVARSQPLVYSTHASPGTTSGLCARVISPRHPRSQQLSQIARAKASSPFALQLYTPSTAQAQPSTGPQPQLQLPLTRHAAPDAEVRLPNAGLPCAVVGPARRIRQLGDSISSRSPACHCARVSLAAVGLEDSQRAAEREGQRRAFADAREPCEASRVRRRALRVSTSAHNSNRPSTRSASAQPRPACSIDHSSSVGFLALSLHDSLWTRAQILRARQEARRQIRSPLGTSVANTSQIPRTVLLILVPFPAFLYFSPDSLARSTMTSLLPGDSAACRPTYKASNAPHCQFEARVLATCQRALYLRGRPRPSSARLLDLILPPSHQPDSGCLAQTRGGPYEDRRLPVRASSGWPTKLR